MTDNEIIESMKGCMRATSCYDATYAALKRGLNLIERQRAEIERLEAENDGYKHLDTILHTAIGKLAANIKSEAIREFAEKIKGLAKQKNYLLSDIHNSKDFGMFTLGFEQVIDEILEEMEK